MFRTQYFFYKRIIRKYFRCTLMKLNRKHVAAQLLINSLTASCWNLQWVCCTEDLIPYQRMQRGLQECAMNALTRRPCVFNDSAAMHAAELVCSQIYLVRAHCYNVSCNILSVHEKRQRHVQHPSVSIQLSYSIPERESRYYLDHGRDYFS